MKGDVESYIRRRKRGDKVFAKDFEAGYAAFRRTEAVTTTTRRQHFPEIGLRSTIGGPEAYVVGHRVAVWEVVDVYREVKSIARTAKHFRWPVTLVRRALAYAKRHPEAVARQRLAEVAAQV